MTFVRRDDSMKPGRGIDGSKGENFTKVNRGDPLTVRPDCAANERSYSRLDSDNGGDKWGEYGVDQMNRMRTSGNLEFAERSGTFGPMRSRTMDETERRDFLALSVMAGVKSRGQEILMLAHKQIKGAEPPLEQRIAEFRKHLDSFILGRALEIQQSTSGVPFETIMLMLSQNSGCQCAVATQDRATRKRDAEIAARQEGK